VEKAIFEADRHLIEMPDWLGELADEALRKGLAPLALAGSRSGGCQGAEPLELD
jgi:hypothetical protein